MEEEVKKEEQIISDEQNENTITPSEPTAEQIAFDKKVKELETIGLEKNDIVIFRNNDIGRIDSININKEDLQYRIYVKVTKDIIITLNENFKNTDNILNYDVIRIISPDFTKVKLEIEMKETVLTKEQAQNELTNLKGETIIIE